MRPAHWKNTDSTPEQKREYVARNPGRRKLSNKLSWIKTRYGEAAKLYFIANPCCEVCDEDRLVCLAIHHTDGKRVEKFRTLCHNCHSVEHHGSLTYLGAMV